MIKVFKIRPNGFCGNQKGFGVKHSVYLAQKTAEQYPHKTYLLGEIVHNQHVVRRLEREYGLKMVQWLKDIPSKAVLIVRAHGASPEIYQKAKAKGLRIIDATCPLVAQVHKQVRKLIQEGKEVIYLASKKDHDEAVGVAGEAPDKIKLVTLDAVDGLKIDHPDKTVVLTQTTLSILETDRVLKKLQKRYPQLEIKPHICLATTQRQKAVIKAAKKFGVVIIVGSPTSSNSNRLKEVAQKAGAKAFIVDTQKELKKNWFAHVAQVAVGSGASTPDWILDKVIKRIQNY